MAVYQRKSGHWFVQFAHQGKNYIKSSGSKKKTDAMALERKMRDDIQKHIVLGLPQEIKYIDAVELYLMKKQETTSYKGIVCVAKWFEPHLTGLYMHQISTAIVSDIMDKKQKEGVSNSTLISYKNFLMGIYKMCKARGNAVREYELPKISTPKGKLRYLTIEEEVRLLAELNPTVTKRGNESTQQMRQDNYDFVVLALDTGARFKELATLTWDAVNLDTGEIHIWRSKTKNESTLLLTDRSWSMLRGRAENKSSSGYIFTGRDGISPKTKVEGIRRAMDKVGLEDCSLHTTRHSFASRMVQSGASIQEVQQLLGHSKITTTAIYAHLDQTQTTTKARDIMNKVNKAVVKGGLKVVG